MRYKKKYVGDFWDHHLLCNSIPFLPSWNIVVRITAAAILHPWGDKHENKSWHARLEMWKDGRILESCGCIWASVPDMLWYKKNKHPTEVCSYWLYIAVISALQIHLLSKLLGSTEKPLLVNLLSPCPLFWIVPITTLLSIPASQRVFAGKKVLP